ncbi:MAG: hypothetical protein FWF51_09550 [Chitinivibrionia bacterium]|nr:hypothetical protein [Chitinivibrionia bacterium]
MKKLFCVFALSALVFAQEAGEFVPVELAFLTTESSVVSDGGSLDFTVEAIEPIEVIEAVEAIIADVAEPVFEVVEMGESGEVETIAEVEVVAEIETVVEIEAVALAEVLNEDLAFEEITIESLIEEQSVENSLPKILFTVNGDAQIICEFTNSGEDKIIEIVCISQGKAVLEISASATENHISIPSGKLDSGIYIVRILSSQNKSSLFSKAIVIG